MKKTLALLLALVMEKLIELHPFEENCTEYVIITLDDSGTVRKYAKECKPLEKWLQIAVM